jgi:predicted nucleic acid-binding protein
VVLLGFLRLLSGRQLVEKPYRTEELFRIVQEWTSLPNVRLLAESPTTLQILADLCIRHSISGSLLTDACIVAQVLEFGGTLFTNDSDFVVFSEIVPVNPL